MFEADIDFANSDFSVVLFATPGCFLQILSVLGPKLSEIAAREVLENSGKLRNLKSGRRVKTDHCFRLKQNTKPRKG